MSCGSTCQTKLRKIKVSQSNCLQYIFFASKRENPTSYFILLGILKLESIFKLKIADHVHKIQFQKTEHLLLSMIWYNSLPKFVIIILDMPLTRTSIGHPLDLNMALQGLEQWNHKSGRQYPLRLSVCHLIPSKKNISVSYSTISFNYYLALSSN